VCEIETVVQGLIPFLGQKQKYWGWSIIFRSQWTQIYYTEPR